MLYLLSLPVLICGVQIRNRLIGAIFLSPIDAGSQEAVVVARAWAPRDNYMTCYYKKIYKGILTYPRW